MGLTELRKEYPWPENKPALSKVAGGWAPVGDKVLIKKYCTDNVRVIVEIGAYLGMHAEYFMELAHKDATLICVDIFEKYPEYTYFMQPPAPLLEQFMANMWEFRDRIVPMACISPDALWKLKAFGVVPDLIFVDGNHEFRAVIADIECSMTAFPNAQIIGHDWDKDWQEVKDAVECMASKYNMRIDTHTEGAMWALVKR